MQSRSRNPRSRPSGHAPASFSGCSVPPWWEFVRNKPNFSIADCGLSTDLQQDALCGPPGRGPVVQTNPIGRGQSCETKPIPLTGRKSQVLAGTRVMVNWTCIPDKANSRRRRVGRGRRDVGRGANASNKPNLPPAARGPAGFIVRKKPNWPRPIMRNKANWARAGPGGTRPGGRGPGGVVQTNPIPAIVPIRRSAFPGGTIVPNKAKLERPWGIWRPAREGSLSCKTNPTVVTSGRCRAPDAQPIRCRSGQALRRADGKIDRLRFRP